MPEATATFKFDDLSHLESALYAIRRQYVVLTLDEVNKESPVFTIKFSGSEYDVDGASGVCKIFFGKKI